MNRYANSIIGSGISLCFVGLCFVGLEARGASIVCNFELGEGRDQLRTVGGVGDSAKFRDYSVMVTASTIEVFDPISQSILRRQRTASGCLKKNSLENILLSKRNFYVKVVRDGENYYGLTSTGKLERFAQSGESGSAFIQVAPGEEAGTSTPRVLGAKVAEELPSLPNNPGIFSPPSAAGSVQSKPPGLEAGGVSDLTREYSSGIAVDGSNRIVRYRLILCSPNDGVIETWDEETPATVTRAPIQSLQKEWLGSIAIFDVVSKDRYSVLINSYQISSQGMMSSVLSALRFNLPAGRVSALQLSKGLQGGISEVTAINTFNFQKEISDNLVTARLESKSGAGEKKESLRITVGRIVAGNEKKISSSVNCTSNAWTPKSTIKKELNAEQLEIVRRADEFIYAKWCAKRENLRRPGNCTAPYTTPETGWKQPFNAARTSVGSKVTGVFYLWGGKQSIDKIMDRYGEQCTWPSSVSEHKKQSAVAGNVCTKVTNGKPAWNPSAAGIDCSGFVARAWGLRESPGTGEIASGLSKYGLSFNARLDDIKVGDAFLYRNSQGGHIRLFGGWVNSPLGLKVRIYESTTENICSGTCLRDVGASQVAGYRSISKLSLRKN